jgi:tRNA dimethylallyltransferase
MRAPAIALRRPREDDQLPLGAHGLDDVRALNAGEISRAECERRLATRTRQFAKRQDTWRRRLEHAELVDANRPATAVADDIAERLRA